MAANRKTPTLTLTKKTTIVKPAEPTPSENLSFSTIDNDPHLEIICQTIYVYRPKSSTPLDQPSPDPAVILRQGLSRALVYYYPLAGKLKRRADGTLQITCNADGVPLAEATVDFTLDSLDYLDRVDTDMAKAFLLDFPNDSEHGYHPLVLQVTKFSCGGFTVGMGMSHSVCDGLGAAQFFKSMAELATVKDEPTVKPVWERERLVGLPSDQHEYFQLMDMSSLTISPFLPAEKLCHECFDVDAESIRRLKSTTADEPCTTLEILGAYVWRSRFRALKQDPERKTALHVAVGIRNLVNPPLPDGYYGNAFVSTRVFMTGQDLDREPPSEVAKLIKQSKKAASDGDSIKEWLAFSEAFRRRNMKIDDCGASMVLTDWRRLKLVEEVDFGWEGAVNMLPVPWNVIEFVNLCIFLPANKVNPSMEGGVRVLVSLPGDAVAVFKHEMDALKIGAGDIS